MKFIKNDVIEEIGGINLLVNPLINIERCGRISYKSESELTKETALKFIDDRIKSGHLSILEHGFLCFSCSNSTASYIITKLNLTILRKYILPYIEYITLGVDETIFIMNYRTAYNFIDICFKYNIHSLLDLAMNIRNSYTNKVFSKHLVYAGDIKVKVNIHHVNIEKLRSIEKELYPILYTTVIFNTNRGVTHELVRHRKAKFVQESTRFCNYSKDRFSNQLNIIDGRDYITGKLNKFVYMFTLYIIEKAYMYLTKHGVQAQIARGILPNDLKSTIAVTANNTEWLDIIEQRHTNKAAHPHMRELMNRYLQIKKY